VSRFPSPPFPFDIPNDNQELLIKSENEKRNAILLCLNQPLQGNPIISKSVTGLNLITQNPVNRGAL
jgi:hypothetical protein